MPYIEKKVNCGFCNGNGYIDHESCWNCYGDGYEIEEEWVADPEPVRYAVRDLEAEENARKPVKYTYESETVWNPVAQKYVELWYKVRRQGTDVTATMVTDRDLREELKRRRDQEKEKERLQRQKDAEREQRRLGEEERRIRTLAQLDEHQEDISVQLPQQPVLRSKLLEYWYSFLDPTLLHFSGSMITCPECNGTGETTGGQTCDICDGGGEVYEARFSNGEEGERSRCHTLFLIEFQDKWATPFQVSRWKRELREVLAKSLEKEEQDRQAAIAAEKAKWRSPFWQFIVACNVIGLPALLMYLAMLYLARNPLERRPAPEPPAVVSLVQQR